MADELAVRVYHSEVDRLREQANRAVDRVRHHLDDTERWLGNPAVSGLRVETFGADTAELVKLVAALKALVDVRYLVERE